MKLYSVHRSPFGARVRAAAAFKGVVLEALGAPPEGLKAPAYLALNPLGKLPTLVLDDGAAVPESQVIVDLLEDVSPTPTLYPGDALARSRARLIPRLVDLYVLPPLFELFAHIDPARRDEGAVAAIFTRFGAGLDAIEVYLADHGFAVGGTFSAADCALAPAVFWIETVDRLFARSAPGDRPKMMAYAQLVKDDALLGPMLVDMATDLATVMR
jgi:glutathione S-transferase